MYDIYICDTNVCVTVAGDVLCVELVRHTVTWWDLVAVIFGRSASGRVHSFTRRFAMLFMWPLVSSLCSFICVSIDYLLAVTVKPPSALSSLSLPRTVFRKCHRIEERPARARENDSERKPYPWAGWNSMLYLDEALATKR